ncbi:MAG: glycine--tRNA ligase subunit beta [Gallionellales bacterium GWA2_60_18]|nr:MAG: glycine--tRNA ligase subunit beta [Gallionellales bacterium GWA2_60_18]
MSTKNLLVELLVEELPPKALKKLGEAFGELLFAELQKSNCLDNGTKLTIFASPRRLAAHVSNVLPEGMQKSIKMKLMPVSIALDDHGKPTPALVKKLQALSLEYLLTATQTVWDMRILKENDGKAESLFYIDQPSPQPYSHSVQSALNRIENNLPIPKLMTYQLADGWSSVNFVRPAHRLVALYGAEVVKVDPHHPDRPVVILGLQAGRETQGHRFEASSATLEIRDADSYEAQLENEGAVIPSFEKRRAEIARQLAAAAAKEGLHPINDDALLDEVTALVERPNVLLGKFEEAFLEVPQECLILTMKANQKYFPLLDAAGKLTNKFLIVSNIRPTDASLVIGGNERVVRPRLADAKFFFDQDRKKTLESRVLGLAKVVYHNKLGTQGERVERVCAIAKAIGQQLGGDSLALQAEQAALLAKADLLTDMVGEFPELQGIMGRYYAQHDGLSDDIAYAIEDHYKPRFAGDELPRNPVGTCVALADKLETLVGMFGIGQIPTGDKDPFALRRHALGVIRMLVENELSLNLHDLIGSAFSGFPQGLLTDAHSEIETFVFERLGGMMREQGYSYTSNEVDAVLSLRPQRLSEVRHRLIAVRVFAELPEAAALAAANKRVGNILRKAEGHVQDEVDPALLHEPAEQALYRALNEIAPRADAAFAAGDYTASLRALAALRAPVDAFFDDVMVNVEDERLRANRLALLARLLWAMNRIADISRLAA